MITPAIIYSKGCCLKIITKIFTYDYCNNDNCNYNKLKICYLCDIQ